MNQNIPKVMIFEPMFGGHQGDHIRAMVDYWHDRQCCCDLLFVVGAGFQERFADLRNAVNSAGRSVCYTELSPRETEDCTQGGLVARGKARWRLAQEHADASNAAHVYFIELDLLQVAIGLHATKKQKWTISGTLFRATVHYGAMGEGDFSIGERLRELRQRVLYHWMLRNPALVCVFSLDPYFVAYAKANLGRANRFCHLPEAYGAGAKGQGLPWAWRRDLQPGRLTFVLYGVLAKRKGIVETANAIALLPAHVAASTQVIFAGRVDRADGADFAAAVERARSRNPAANVVVIDRFLEVDELEYLTSAADVILMPYIRHPGSSAALVRACAFGQPVVSQRYGLLGRWVIDHRAGLAVKTEKPGEIAKAISLIVERGPAQVCDRELMARFAASHGPQAFADTLFRTWMSDTSTPILGRATVGAGNI
jgi:glycosyltransferase involved in cell wall biosynthesis